jgi:hypothetical protein
MGNSRIKVREQGNIRKYTDKKNTQENLKLGKRINERVKSERQ